MGNVAYENYHYTDDCYQICGGCKPWITGVNPDVNYVHKCVKYGSLLGVIQIVMKIHVQPK